MILVTVGSCADFDFVSRAMDLGTVEKSLRAGTLSLSLPLSLALFLALSVSLSLTHHTHRRSVSPPLALYLYMFLSLALSHMFLSLSLSHMGSLSLPLALCLPMCLPFSLAHTHTHSQTHTEHPYLAMPPLWHPWYPHGGVRGFVRGFSTRLSRVWYEGLRGFKYEGLVRGLR